MFFDFVGELAIGSVVDANHFTGATKRNQGLVGADIGGENGVCLVAHGGDTLPCGDVE